MKKFISIWSAIFTFGLLLSASSAAQADTTENTRQVIQAFVQMLYEQRDVRGAYERYAVPDLIQHSAGIADGREAVIREIEGLLKNPAAKFDVQRILVDHDLAAVHFRGQLDAQGPGAAVVEIFRLKDGKIVEHWDVFQVISGSAKNPHPHF